MTNQLDGRGLNQCNLYLMTRRSAVKASDMATAVGY